MRWKASLAGAWSPDRRPLGIGCWRHLPRRRDEAGDIAVVLPTGRRSTAGCSDERRPFRFEVRLPVRHATIHRGPRIFKEVWRSVWQPNHGPDEELGDVGSRCHSNACTPPTDTTAVSAMRNWSADRRSNSKSTAPSTERSHSPLTHPHPARIPSSARANSHLARRASWSRPPTLWRSVGSGQ